MCLFALLKTLRKHGNTKQGRILSINMFSCVYLTAWFCLFVDSCVCVCGSVRLRVRMLQLNWRTVQIFTDLQIHICCVHLCLRLPNAFYLHVHSLLFTHSDLISSLILCIRVTSTRMMLKGYKVCMFVSKSCVSFELLIICFMILDSLKLCT